MEFVAPVMRHRKRHVSVTDAGQFGQQIGEMPSQQMYHLPFALDAAPTPSMPAARIIGDAPTAGEACLLEIQTPALLH
jgi:hypothetical protein